MKVCLRRRSTFQYHLWLSPRPLHLLPGTILARRSILLRIKWHPLPHLPLLTRQQEAGKLLVVMVAHSLDKVLLPGEMKIGVCVAYVVLNSDVFMMIYVVQLKQYFSITLRYCSNVSLNHFSSSFYFLLDSVFLWEILALDPLVQLQKWKLFSVDKQRQCFSLVLHTCISFLGDCIRRFGGLWY